jgi:hypothetical protein
VAELVGVALGPPLLGRSIVVDLGAVRAWSAANAPNPRPTRAYVLAELAAWIVGGDVVCGSIRQRREQLARFDEAAHIAMQQGVLAAIAAASAR